MVRRVRRPKKRKQIKEVTVLPPNIKPSRHLPAVAMMKGTRERLTLKNLAREHGIENPAAYRNQALLEIINKKLEQKGLPKLTMKDVKKKSKEKTL